MIPDKTVHEKAILFTRYPKVGKVKTRLIPALGPEGACELHRQMTELALNQLRELSGLRPVSIEVRFEGGNEDLMREWLGTDVGYFPQHQGDLGIRMERAFQESFQSGFESVVLIGSDCPERTASILQKAFEGLKDKDLILGPARDGGYYLIGLKKPHLLFTDVPWGSAEVFNLTREKARTLGLKVLLLETLQDIDRPEDLSSWEQIKAFLGGSCPGLSIIIPTLNEAEHILLTLTRIPKTPFVEVLVADGGSHDGTPDLAASWGATVLPSSPGRACQMNTAARQAKGELLLFLHADTHLPEKFAEQICRILSRPETSAGAFQLKFDTPLPGLGVIERLANWRARVWQMPYGDQALFLRAERFKALGGFAEIPFLEDVDLVRRLRRQGPIVIAPVPAITSSRRWKNSGVLKTTLKNQIILAAYWAGISPYRLARWYHKETGRRPMP